MNNGMNKTMRAESLLAKLDHLTAQQLRRLLAARMDAGIGPAGDGSYQVPEAH